MGWLYSSTRLYSKLGFSTIGNLRDHFTQSHSNCVKSQVIPFFLQYFFIISCPKLWQRLRQSQQRVEFALNVSDISACEDCMQFTALGTGSSRPQCSGCRRNQPERTLSLSPPPPSAVDFLLHRPTGSSTDKQTIRPTLSIVRLTI